MQWSTCTMASRCGASPATVARIWQDFALQPHRDETFGLCLEPVFEPQVRDILGLFLDPPERAVVLCAAEESRAESMRRSQPLPSVRPDAPGVQADDAQSLRAISQFTALDTATRQPIPECSKRHPTVDFRKFLNGVGTAVPAGLEFHLLLDNFGTHKAAMIHDWLAAYPHYHLHLTATSGAWISKVEHWYANPPEQQIRHGTLRNGQGLKEAIEEYLAVQGGNLQPFIWTKSVEQIVHSAGD